MQNLYDLLKLGCMAHAIRFHLLTNSLVSPKTMIELIFCGIKSFCNGALPTSSVSLNY
jgi:hypothetical protein